MAITRLNNNSITSVTALPSAIPTGKVLQVKQTYVDTISSQSISIGTWTPITDLEVSITPSSASSKILIFVEWNGESGENYPHNNTFGIQRNSTDIGLQTGIGSRQPGITSMNVNHTANADSTPESAVYNFLDSPATTSAITYKACIWCQNAQTLYNNRTVNASDTLDYERLTSSITVMEIAG